MRSVPTTSIDLADPDVVADPYPHFAEERRHGPLAWHEPSGRFLTFDHATAGAVLRDLLASALTPLSKRPGGQGLTAATRVLGDATDLMCSDIYIVDPDRMPRRERHTRTRGAH